MKNLILTLAIAAIAPLAVADEKKVSTTTTTIPGSSSTTTTTTYGSGTITEYSPGKTFIVKESSGAVTYRYGDKVTYVTRSGKVLTDADVRTRVRVGVPVRVHYSGPDRVISRVELEED